MEAQGIISKYDGHDISLEWLNSFVIVKKPNGSLHICLDPTDLNKEIIRPVCNAQTMDDVVHKLKDAKFFAVFNTSKGFFHGPLDAESKVLTAMLTPFGIHVYNVLAMGLSSATDLFETCIHEILQGLNGCTNIADDVLVFGATYDEFKANVIAFLDHYVQEDMHLNPGKVKIDASRFLSLEMFCPKMVLVLIPGKSNSFNNGQHQLTTRNCSLSLALLIICPDF